MEILEIDRNEIQKKFKNCSQLREIIDSIEKNLWVEQKVICQIKVNDKWLSEYEETEASSMSIRDLDFLCVQTKDLVQVVRENIKALDGWIENAKSALQHAVSFIDLGQYKKCNDILVSVFEGSQWFSESVYLIQRPIEQLGHPLVNPPLWKDLQEQFTKSALNLVKGFQNNDYGLISDVISFELIENFNKWLEILKEQGKMSSK